jgi:hypothetical protein
VPRASPSSGFPMSPLPVRNTLQAGERHVKNSLQAASASFNGLSFPAAPVRGEIYVRIRPNAWMSTVHALTILIQRANDQAALLAKSCPHQSACLKLRNQGLDLGQTTASVLHSHCAQ